MQTSHNTEANSSLFKKVILRFIPYTLVIFAISGSLPAVVENGDFIVFKENGPIEWLQFTILLFSAIILLLYSRLEGYTSGELFSIIALVETAAAIREMDATFDKFIPFLGWQFPFVVCVIIGVFIFLKNKDKVIPQLNGFVCSRAFSLLWCGFIVTVPFTQLIGHGDFLQSLMGNDYVRDYKRVIEELGELLGYMLILIGSFEAVLQQKEPCHKT
jgi:hypothetical protein